MEQTLKHWMFFIWLFDYLSKYDPVMLALTASFPFILI